LTACRSIVITNLRGLLKPDFSGVSNVTLEKALFEFLLR